MDVVTRWHSIPRALCVCSLQRTLEEERCLASPTGALTIMAAGCEESGWAWVKGSARWNRRFFVLSRLPDGDGGSGKAAAGDGSDNSEDEDDDYDPNVVLHRFQSDVARRRPLLPPCRVSPDLYVLSRTRLVPASSLSRLSNALKHER